MSIKKNRFFLPCPTNHTHTLVILATQELELILTAFAAEPAEFRDQEGMNNKVTAMLGITSHGGTSGYKAASNPLFTTLALLGMAKEFGMGWEAC
jgi:hypothetical protein